MNEAYPKLKKSEDNWIIVEMIRRNLAHRRRNKKRRLAEIEGMPASSVYVLFRDIACSPPITGDDAPEPRSNEDQQPN